MGASGRQLTFELIRPPERHFHFTYDLLEAGDEVIVTAHQISPSRPLVYGGEEVIGSGYWSVWFLYNGKPWDVGRFYRPDGTFTGYYADVLEPVHWENADPETLHPLVDLFLDLWIAPDGSYLVLDEDEFDEAVQAGVLDAAQIMHARSVVRDLTVETEGGRFPPEFVRNFRR